MAGMTSTMVRLRWPVVMRAGLLLVLAGLAAPAGAQTRRGIMPGLHLGVQTGPALFTHAAEIDRTGGQPAGLDLAADLSYQMHPVWGLGLSYGRTHFRSATGIEAAQQEVAFWMRTSRPGRIASPYVEWGAHYTRRAGTSTAGALIQLGADWHLDAHRRAAVTTGLRLKTGQVGTAAPVDTRVHGPAALRIGLRLRLARRYPPPRLDAVFVPDTVFTGERVWMEAHIGGQPDTKRYDYTWTLNDTATVRGNPVDYVFHTPGRHRIVVTAANPSGTDTQARALLVLPAPSASPEEPGTTRERPAPPEIVAIYGPRTLQAGQLHHFHVRVRSGLRWPVEHEWDMGDGTISPGNNISHRYQTPGTYVITVRSRNIGGMDEDTLHVRVVPPPVADAAAEPEPSASRPRRTPRTPPSTEPPPAPTGPADASPEAMLMSTEGVIWSRGGYTWVVATSFSQFGAERLAQQYRRAGFRVGVWADTTGPGTTAYRVVIGQFATEAQALAARDTVQRQTTNQIWLLQIPRSPEE